MEEEKQINGKVNLTWDYFSEYAKAPNRTGTKIEGVNVVSPTFFHLIKNGEGKLHANVGDKGKSYIKWAKQNNYKVWGMVSNNSYKEISYIDKNLNILLNNIYVKMDELPACGSQYNHSQ